MSGHNLSVNDSAARAKARKLIEVISEENFHVDDKEWEELEASNPRLRTRLQSTFSRLREVAGHSVKTLAEQLYNSSARFVFELLQNAEDNHYSRARERGHEPYISFQVYDDRIIMDCNEDGFKEENVRAICDVGKSSKVGAQGYIGAKGIGFKSVFMAAWRVHIQSGDFSFYFNRQDGDSGIGMIVPLWQDHLPDVPPHITRMTLLLHNTGDQATLLSQRRPIRQQFDDLQGSELLFMRNLRKISISFIGNDGTVQNSTVFSVSEIDTRSVTINKSIAKGAETVKMSHQTYRIFKKSVGDLPKHDDREYSEQEDRLRAYAKADVTLAFPIDDDSVPIIEPQDVFAFLPTRHKGFSFLIQSDFVTEANRQDIVATSPRNHGILQHIGDVFIQSVLQFCEHPHLRYTWMRFLPKKGQYPYDQFWSTLVHLIERKLETIWILLPRSERKLQRINELRELKSRYCDCEGEPLFRDNMPEKWLSQAYLRDDIRILKSWGMPKIRAEEILSMVQKDLNSADSRMKSEETDDDWHTRAANMLSEIAKGSASTLSTLRTLELVPCRGKELNPYVGNPTSWIAANSVTTPSTICFAETEEGIVIPNDLGLHIITSTASKSAALAGFLKLLGVITANTNELRDMVHARHRTYLKRRVGITIPTVVDQLKFLYLTDPSDLHSVAKKSQLALVDESRKWWGPSDNDDTLYLSDESPYGPSELLRATPEAPGMEVRFLHNLFTQNPPEQPSSNAEEWSDWLAIRAGVEDKVRVLKTQHDLSDECYYIARHRPEKFLGFLRSKWVTNEIHISRQTSPVLYEKLGEIKVRCHNDRMTPLSETYLPLHDLQEECNRFLPQDHGFPFVDIEEDVSRETYKVLNWDFLIDWAGVSVQDDLSFYLAILEQLCGSVEDYVEDDGTAIRVVNLYSMIYTKFAQSTTTRRIQSQQIMDFFQENDAIYVPACGRSTASWTSAEHCLWQGLPMMTTRHTLQQKYDELRDEMDVEIHNVERLFCDLLGIQDCQWRDLIYELDNVEFEEDDPAFEEVTKTYEYLLTFAQDLEDSELEDLRNEFTSKCLIYRPSDDSNDWRNLQQCLWSSSAKVRGKITLIEYYEDLEEFFIDVLRAETLTLEMVYDELILLGSSSDTSAIDVRDPIMSLNSFLMDTELVNWPNANNLIRAKILPIRAPNQTVSLASAETDFVIVDRTHLGEIFAATVKTLDFSFDDVRRLNAFIQFLGQSRKRLSEAIREVTTVDGSEKQSLQSRQRQIGPKAHALYRVAFHFNSPKLKPNGRDLFNLLRTAKVYTTEGISSELHLSQDGKLHRHIKERSDLHIREHESQLEIFVSKNKKEQDFCYSSKLSKHLFQWLMTETISHISDTLDSRGFFVVNKILNSRCSVLAQILEEDGIATGDIEDPNLSAESDDDSDEEYSEEDETAGVSTPADGGTVSFQFSGIRDANFHQLETFQTSPVAWRTTQASEDVVTESLNYRNLLKRVVETARSSQLPQRDSFDVSGMASALPVFYDSVDSFDGFFESARFYSDSALERRKKIGAAGELFVFEMLKRCQLPNFSIDNWQSNIRHYAAAHPDYADIRKWPGKETSDLTYQDIQGELTSLLIDAGQLDGEVWRDRRPFYFLEVKTTTGSCNTPFFVSKRQYERICDYKNTADTVYIIFRVFHAYSNNIRASLFLNPGKMMDDGQLLFTAEKWSVVSGHL